MILLNSHLIFHIIWRSHFIFSHENHWVAWSFWTGNIFKWYSNIFNTPCHLKKMEEVMSSSLQGLVVKRIWIHRDHKKIKVWESPFIPSHFTFKSSEFHSINHTTIKQTINQSIYYNIPKFRILGCYKCIIAHPSTPPEAFM